MTEQVSPDELTSENQLICEKLLGWQKVVVGTDNYPAFKRNWHEDPIYAPDFTTWTNAGLILDALSARGVDPTLEYSDGKWDCYGGDPFESFIHAYRDTGPLAVRAAALEYIRRQS